MSDAEFPPKQKLANPLNVATTMVAAFLLALLGMLIGIASGVEGTELAMLALSLTMLLISVCPMLIERARPVAGRHILISLWSVGMGLYFALPIFHQYFFMTEPVDGIARLRNLQPSDIVNGQLIALLALLATYAGYFFPLSRAAAQFLPRPRFDWSHQTALMVALVIIPTGWLVLVGGQFGLIPKSLGSGALGAVATMAFLGFALLGIIATRYRSRQAVLLTIVLLVPSMIFAFFTGSKRLVLSPVMCLALGYFVCVRRISFRWVMAGAFLLIVLYPIASFYREFVLIGNRLLLADVITNPGRIFSLLATFMESVSPAEYVLGGIEAAWSRLDVLGILSLIVRDTPDRVPYQGGWTIGYVFISFIPRIIWPGKPSMGVGQWITDNFTSYGGVTSSTGSSWVGEFFLNFGVMGVLVGMLVIGMYFRLLHELLFRSMTVPALFGSTVVLWASCTTIEMNLIAPFTGTIFTLAPVLMAHIAVRMFAQPDRRNFEPRTVPTFDTLARAPDPPGARPGSP